MRSIILIILSIGCVHSIIAQAPKQFKYQAVARDINNQPYVNAKLKIKFSILANSPAGSAQYVEEHTVTTSLLGVFDANIGGGIKLQGSMDGIDWSINTYYIKIELNPQLSGGSFINMGTSQLLSVPYAMYANTSGGGGSDNQQLSLSGNQLSISNGNSVNLPENPQFLNLSGSQLSITNGNSVTLPTSGQGYFESAGGNDIQNNNNGIVFINGSPYQQLFVSGNNNAAAIFAQNNGGGPAISADGGSGTGIVASTTGNGFAMEVTGSGHRGIFIDNGFSFGVSAIGEAFGVEGYSSQGKAGLFQGKNGIECYGDNLGIETRGLTGINAESTNPTGYSGWFKQRLHADIMEKGSGSFKIDHPLDPQNKYLYHSFVESPDMMNVYNGNISTDTEGRAIVTLPSYFEALNMDFRYQLTCVGTFAQVYVEKEIENNTLIIKADKPNVKVSWQVTGIRKDVHAEKYRIVPQANKEEEYKGKYLCPTCFNQPEAQGIRYIDRQKEAVERDRLVNKKQVQPPKK